MKRSMFFHTLFLGVVITAAFSFTGGTVMAEEMFCSCELYTQTDAKALFNENVSDGVARETVSPAGNSCRYTFNRDGSVFGMTIRISTTGSIIEEGIFDSAGDVFERQVRTRKANEEAAKKFQEIEAVGDAAFWEGTSLWVLKGDVLLIIKINSALKGSFSNREALDLAREEQDLALSLKVAETVLPRLE